MQRLKWFVGAIALLALACGEVSETSTPVIREGEGLLELPLVSTSAGRSYKLVGATFAITGPQNATIADTSAESVSLALIAGAYTIQMNGEWHVERTDAPGVEVPVTLVSPNPMSFTLDEGETRPVRFLFKVPGDATADVGIGVDSGGWISGTIQFEPSEPGYPYGIFAELAGKSIPFVISYESSTVTRSMEYGRKRTNIQTAPVTFQLGGSIGAAVQQQFVAALQGQSMSFFMEAAYGSPEVIVESIFLVNMERGIGFDVYHPIMPTLGLDADGYPLAHSVAIDTGYAHFTTPGSGILDGVLTSGTFTPQ
ncbi:hypothetical protein HJC10_25725 [Corallococcus exiguus]|uniref:hypothetical protein n=1 Tax=Corallococcus exiguus TaxID=83462 RepID=UPI001470F1BB|nr:hypothetical protein [Corallococcus exiguus]NNB88070.1 hypothetical protein [Corallococcus exiguus]NNC06235.1 hypothetical protein [Corallococcus exiguus]